MRITKINRFRISQKALAEAGAILRNGGVVAFPTETAYGLAADPAQLEAIQKVFAIKGREVRKQLPFVAADTDQVERYFTLDKPFSELAQQHWPGPLTLVLSAKRTPLTQWPAVAVRVPDAAWASALPQELYRPLTSTSANLAGQPACYSAAAIKRQFRDQPVQPDLILDAGSLPKRPVSTIVAMQNRRLTVLRPGPIAVE